MAARLLLAWLALALFMASPSLASHTTIINNGPNSNRVNIVFLGDGYTSSQINTTYPAHIVAMTNYMFNPASPLLSQPYPRYKNFFNVHRINVVSAESGADIPPEGVFRNTALDATYFFDGTTDRLLYVNNTKANNALNAGLADAGFTADMRYVTVNDTRYGGGGGSYAVYAGGNGSALEVALHEMGHSFNGLADEYGGFMTTYTGPEPSEINVTRNSAGTKWSHWVGYNQTGIGLIGAYQGGRYYDLGIYRPSQNSKMRSLGQPFDAIAREKIVLDIYANVDPLDAFLNNGLPLLDPPELWVDSIDPGVIDTEWFVNGTKVNSATAETFKLTDYGYGPGVYTVRARAFDPTGFDPLNGWVRRNQSQLEQFVTWTVTQTVPEPATIVLVSVGVLGVVLLAARRRTSQARVASLPVHAAG